MYGKQLFQPQSAVSRCMLDETYEPCVSAGHAHINLLFDLILILPCKQTKQKFHSFIPTHAIYIIIDELYIIQLRPSP